MISKKIFLIPIILYPVISIIQYYTYHDNPNYHPIQAMLLGVMFDSFLAFATFLFRRGMNNLEKSAKEELK